MYKSYFRENSPDAKNILKLTIVEINKIIKENKYMSYRIDVGKFGNFDPKDQRFILDSVKKYKFGNSTKVIDGVFESAYQGHAFFILFFLNKNIESSIEKGTIKFLSSNSDKEEVEASSLREYIDLEGVNYFLLKYPEYRNSINKAMKKLEGDWTLESMGSEKFFINSNNQNQKDLEDAYEKTLNTANYVTGLKNNFKFGLVGNRRLTSNEWDKVIDFIENQNYGSGIKVEFIPEERIFRVKSKQYNSYLSKKLKQIIKNYEKADEYYISYSDLLEDIDKIEGILFVENEDFPIVKKVIDSLPEWNMDSKKNIERIRL